MLIEKKLKFLVAGTLCFFLTKSLQAQNFGVFISPGLMNYTGDLQDKNYTFNQAGFSISGGILYNLNHFTVRGAFTYGKIQASDSVNSRFKGRNLSFQSNIAEGSLTLEYDIFNLNNKKFTPYVLAGGAVYYYNPYTSYNGQKIYLQPLSTEGQGLAAYPDRKEYSLTQFAVPLGIGFKYKLSEQFQIGIEFSSRLLFTDYIDDVSTDYPDEATLLKDRGQLAVDLSWRGDERNPDQPFPSNKQRGNSGQNDNYYTSALTLIYMFPHSETYGRRKYSHAVDCPKL